MYLRSHSTTQEIIESTWHPSLKAKVIDPKDLSGWSISLKKQGTRIVTLNGSFDLLHSGHLKILSEAFNQKGDQGVLVVALNTDASIQRYKSKDRPIVPFIHRLHMMASILFVDYVTWFDEDDPRILLQTICPHIHVNGSEYGINCIEADVVHNAGGSLFIVDRIEGLSTSEIIKKIQTIEDK
jgi:rfaE bifunctional protein nucleotidyltransferase chain/domain